MFGLTHRFHAGAVRRTAATALMLFIGTASSSGAVSTGMEDREIAVLQGLDKVTARISRIEAPINRVVTFGSLDIIVRACREAPPIEPPESAAFLEIEEVKTGEMPQEVFSGWMFASSPALSPMEHPVYDVWVLDCKNFETSEASSPQ